MSEPLTDEELRYLDSIRVHHSLVLSRASAKIGKLRDELKLERDGTLNYLDVEINRNRELRAEKANLIKTLESIRERTKCGGSCWYGEFGRHTLKCQWSISEEADAALKDAAPLHASPTTSDAPAPDLAERLVGCLVQHFLTLSAREDWTDHPTVYLNAVKSELRAIIAAAEPERENDHE